MYGGNLTQISLDRVHPLHLDVESAPKTRPCPRCGTRNTLNAADCGSCGTNFTRHRLALEVAAQARPVYVKHTAAEQKRTREMVKPPKVTSPLPVMMIALAVLAAVAFALFG